MSGTELFFIVMSAVIAAPFALVIICVGLEIVWGFFKLLYELAFS